MWTVELEQQYRQSLEKLSEGAQESLKANEENKKILEKSLAEYEELCQKKQSNQ